MSKNNIVKILVAGLIDGFTGNGVLGALFSSPRFSRYLTTLNGKASFL